MFHFRTNHQPPPRTAGRLRVVPLFSLARRRMGEDFEEDGRGRRGWNGNRRRRRRGEDFERREEDGEDGRGMEEEGNWTFRRKEREFERDETKTLRREKQGLGEGQKQGL